MDTFRIPAERAVIGDQVRAVEQGPIGTVTSIVRGWTVVCYHERHSGGTMCYQHNTDSLYLVRSA
jgi:hypothetical protein